MRLSIVTINLNNSIGLEKTMKSVLDQSFTDYEYIVIDGDSTDGSKGVIKRFDELYGRTTKLIWISEPDTGIYNAINKGIDLARGEYLLFLNSGDFLVNNEILGSVMKLNFTEEYVYGDLNLIRNEVLIYQDVRMKFNEPTLLNLHSESLPHQASFIKRNLFEKYGKYNETFKISGDWEFCILAIIVNNCTVKHIPYTICNYDLDGISNLNSELRNKERREVLDRYFPPRVVADYDKMLYYKKDIVVLDWYNNHRFFKAIMVFLYKAGRKAERLIYK